MRIDFSDNPTFGQVGPELVNTCGVREEESGLISHLDHLAGGLAVVVRDPLLRRDANQG